MLRAKRRTSERPGSEHRMGDAYCLAHLLRLDILAAAVPHTGWSGARHLMQVLPVVQLPATAC